MDVKPVDSKGAKYKNKLLKNSFESNLQQVSTFLCYTSVLYHQEVVEKVLEHFLVFFVIYEKAVVAYGILLVTKKIVGFGFFV